MQCPLCLEEMVLSYQPTFKGKTCGHRLCFSCIKDWMRSTRTPSIRGRLSLRMTKTCPFCRFPAIANPTGIVEKDDFTKFVLDRLYPSKAGPVFSVAIKWAESSTAGVVDKVEIRPIGFSNGLDNGDVGWWVQHRPAKDMPPPLPSGPPFSPPRIELEPASSFQQFSSTPSSSSDLLTVPGPVVRPAVLQQLQQRLSIEVIDLASSDDEEDASPIPSRMQRPLPPPPPIIGPISTPSSTPGSLSLAKQAQVSQPSLQLLSPVLSSSVQAPSVPAPRVPPPDPVQGPLIHTCAVCGKSYDKRNSYNKHVKTAHRSSQMKCTIANCLATFAKQDDMDRHLWEQHGIR